MSFPRASIKYLVILVLDLSQHVNEHKMIDCGHIALLDHNKANKKL